MKRTFSVLCVFAMTAAAQGPQMVTLPAKSPLVTVRMVFRTGAASDPAGREGLASLTASLLAQGGTQKLTYDQVVDALYPMAVNISQHTDKEMTTFSADTHADNLDAFYAIFREMILEPGWREDDLKRLRDDAINALRVSIRGNNDEELGKEVLYNAIYKGHPYGHHNLGTVSALNKITMADLKAFWKSQYTQTNLIIGMAGGYPPEFAARVKKDFMARLAKGKALRATRQMPARANGLQLHIVDKKTRSVAYSFGFPIDVRRGHPDFVALLVAQNFFGAHRSSAGRMYQRIREARGLNYGDYAYIEYFPNGMFRFEPEPNLARPQQVFQVWIRPLETPTAHFGLRLAFHELDKLIKDGLTQKEFEGARNFVSKNVNLLTKTKRSELGYAIDSAFYGIPEYGKYVRDALAKMTAEDVNRAIRKHLRTGDLHVVAITDKGEEFKQKLLANGPSPMKYNAEKPAELLAEDKTVEKRVLPFSAERTRVIPVDQVFE